MSEPNRFDGSEQTFRDAPAEWQRAIASAAAVLDHAGAIGRVEMLCSWALSSRASLRRLAAGVLLVTGRELAAHSILAHLADDPSALVRRAAAAAVHRRYAQNPAAYSAILRRLERAADSATRSRPERHDEAPQRESAGSKTFEREPHATTRK